MTAVTVPLCHDCWDRRAQGAPVPRVRIGLQEQCADCGSSTRSGIYIREHLENVQYPPTQYDEP